MNEELRNLIPSSSVLITNSARISTLSKPGSSNSNPSRTTLSMVYNPNDTGASAEFYEINPLEISDKAKLTTLLASENDSGLDLIDYVLVYYKDNNIKANENRERYLKNLKINGLEVEVKNNTDEKICFVLIKIPLDVALQVAEKMKLKMPIEINDIDDDDSLHNIWRFWTRFESQTPIEIRQRKKRDYFTAPYSSSIKKKFERFFNRDPNKIIPTKDRFVLTYEILSRTTYSKEIKSPSLHIVDENDQNIGIERLLASGVFLAAYPLHERNDSNNEDPKQKTDRMLLWNYWAKPKSWFIYQPLHVVRRYFGEKLAFYFSWLGFYTTWLVMPSIVGFLVFLYGCMTVIWDKPTKEICNKDGPIGKLIMCPLCDDPDICNSSFLHESCLYAQITYLVDNSLTVFFSVFMAVWTVLFIEFWKREQSKLQFEWDSHDFEKKNEPIRPEFELKVSTKRTNNITGAEEPYIPWRKRITRYFFSASVVLLMICLVLALVVGVIAYRVSILMVFPNKEHKQLVSIMSSISAACINLVIIIILSRFYQWIAVKLTDMEYHKTDTQYENSLTIKMYLFQFVNFYASIFYIAFFKGRKLVSSDRTFFNAFREECNQSGCLSELCVQLAIIMVGKQILNNIQEVLNPIVQNYWSRKVSNGTVNKNANNNKANKDKKWKKDYTLMNWTHLTLFDEYLEMVIQYGFITLFVVAFPLGPLFAFLNNIIEIRIDAFKFLTQFRRPLPKKAQDIGIWLPILSAISKLGVITNGLIIAFTSEFIPRMVYRFSEYSENNSLNGYVNFTLSKKTTIFNNQTTVCYYKDFKEAYNSDDKFEYTKIYYYVLVARLTFLVCFEHVVFSIVTIMHWIPDVPKIVADQKERENFIIQKSLWEAKPNENSGELIKQLSPDAGGDNETIPYSY